MIEVSLGEIADLLNADYRGPRDLTVAGVAPLSEADERHVSFLSNPKYAAQLGSTRATAILVARSIEGDSDRWMRVDDPYFAFATVLTRWFAGRPKPQGVSPLAAVAPDAQLGTGVSIGAFSSIGNGVVLGDGVTIYPNVTIEPDVVIGDGTIVYPQVSIYCGSRIGRRCILHSGAVIGSDGYGFATHEGRHHKIPQIGIVRIEDDVEIGAGTTIDRAALGETVIGEGTKIDNLVQVGHNVRIGRHCFLVAQVGVAGSTEIGDYTAVAGQSGFSGHLKIGSHVQVAAKSAVLADVADGEKVMGIPAVPFRDFARREAALRKVTRAARRRTPDPKP